MSTHVNSGYVGSQTRTNFGQHSFWTTPYLHNQLRKKREPFITVALLEWLSGILGTHRSLAIGSGTHQF